MNWGCIPTKYLLQQTKIFTQAKTNANCDGPKEELRCNWSRIQLEKGEVVQRLVKGVEFLLKQCGVDVFKGEAVLRSERQIVLNDGQTEHIFEADRIILATGSATKDLPFLTFNGEEVIDSKKALELEKIPKDMLIVGAGAVGLEIATIFHRLGCRVRILEVMPTILPGTDIPSAKRLERILRLQGLDIATHMRIEEAEVRKGRVVLRGTCMKDNISFEFEAECVLLATGRVPDSSVLGSGGMNILRDDAGFLKVNSCLETEAKGIYAIGDLIGGKLLAHKAAHEGLIAAANASGSHVRMEYHALPVSVFTEPEFACVGLTEKEAKESGREVKVGQFSLQANGRALTLGEVEGLIKVVADRDEKIVGAHVIAPHASEIIAELTLAVKKGLTLQDVATTIHIHPTLSEAVMEAAMHARNEAIHTLNR